ncbi:lipopolysaccharide biosynthesis protein [Microvirga sp. TS319]|uniref:lipopolysaccharide biosynthesis protein n=1 Tax=Microvirga sp. TS319 TaxID=3241165 RepID=UPI00351AA821
MSRTRHRSIVNVGMTASVAVLRACEGLITVAYLLKVLGAENFGIWALISTMAAYLLVLDLGIVGALGRLLAGHRGVGDIEGFNRTLSTALTLLTGAGAVTLLAAVGLAEIFPLIFHVPDHQLADVRMALIIAGVWAALYFPTSVFDVVLWSYERFDLSSLIEMPIIGLRLSLILLLIHEGSPLSHLAAIGLTANVTMVTLQAACAWWVEPRLRPIPGVMSRAALKEIYPIGVWFSALSMARSLTQQIGPTLVGHSLGNRAVATFSIARQLTTYCATVMLSLTQIAAPRAAVLFFGRHGDEQKILFVGGGRAATALALFFAGGFLSLGAPFISVWQGGRQDAAFAPLVVLMLGEAFPMAQGVTYSILTAMGRHRTLARFAIMEGIGTLCLAALLMRPFGILGVCCAIAVSATVFRGLCPWLLACRLLGVAPLAYLRDAVAPVVVCWCGAILLTVMMAAEWPVRGWISLIGYGMLYAALYMPACAILLLGRGALAPAKSLIHRLRIS